MNVPLQLMVIHNTKREKWFLSKCGYNSYTCFAPVYSPTQSVYGALSTQMRLLKRQLSKVGKLALLSLLELIESWLIREEGSSWFA